MTNEDPSHPGAERDALDFVPSRARLESMHQAGLLSDTAYWRARARFVDRNITATRVNLGILFLGVTLIATGVLYFFAYNWDDLSKWQRLGSVGALILTAWGAALRFELDNARGKVALFAATFFIGVFLATFGQIYQTGANAWQLFAAWGALALPWVLVNRFQATWALWLVIVNTGCVLIWQQESWFQDFMPWQLGMTALAISHLGIFGLRERLGAAWLDLSWGRVALVCAIIGWSMSPTLYSIIEGDASILLFLPMTLALQAPLAWYALRKSKDIVTLGLVGVSAIVTALAILGRWTVEDLELFGLFFMGVFSLTSFATLIALLLRLWRTWEADDVANT